MPTVNRRFILSDGKSMPAIAWGNGSGKIFIGFDLIEGVTTEYRPGRRGRDDRVEKGDKGYRYWEGEV